MRVGLYPGSFDPVTHGHVDVVRRAAHFVDRLVIAIGAHHDMESCIAEWVTPLLGQAEQPDPALVAAYDALFPAFAASRRALPPAWDALAAARSLKGHEE